MKNYLSPILFALSLTLATPPAAQAGSSNPSHSTLPSEDVAAFSNRVQQDLAARKVNVAIVGRVGRDPSQLPSGVKYTHVAFWVYSQITRADGSTGRGYRVYNLYQQNKNKSRSDLVQDSPAEFFSAAQKLDAGIIIPDARLQKKLLRVIASPTYTSLHNPRYSVLANPNTSQYQNCTEHTLNILMASLYGTGDVVQIKADITEHFKPQPIALSGFKRMLAPAASQALTTADHGASVKTATFSSIARFMKAHKLARKVYRITPDRLARL